jgi:ABC-type nitrate/sulfonate/bicarbonate transport system permease component
MKRRAMLWGLLQVVILWQLLAWVINQPVLPAPWTVFTIIPTEFVDLAYDFVVSALRVVSSMLLAVIFAVPIGIVLGQFQRINRFLAPLISVTHVIPKIVLLPIILVLVGIGDISRILIIFLILFFQILVVVRDRASQVRAELLFSVRSLGAGKRGLYRFVYLPATIPAVLTALRISTGTSVAVLFFAESFATTSGLGHYILNQWAILRYPQMYAGIITMGILGLSIHIIINQLEKRIIPWQNLPK